MDPLKADPTGTWPIVQRLEKEMLWRVGLLERAIVSLVQRENAFGLRRVSLVVNTRWSFLSDPAKIKEFRKWLKMQVAAGILEADITGKPWMSEYIESAYKKAFVDGWVSMNPTIKYESMANYDASRAEFLKDSFARPIATKRLEALYTRSFEHLTGFNDTMASNLSVVLTEGLAHGRGPKDIAAKMRKVIKDLSVTRARRIARTEIINAYAEGSLDSYEALGVRNVTVLAEWATAGDKKVCPRCRPMEGVVLPIEKARGMIPRHPNCRCAWKPAGVGEDTTSQKHGKQAKQAIKQSVSEERPNASFKKAQKLSKWVGADHV